MLYKRCKFKLLEFQFKFLHHIIYTKRELKAMKLVSDDICSFCKCDQESLAHVFLQCEYVKGFWLSLELFWNSHAKYNINMDAKSILFGYPSRFKLLNHYILLGKRYIFLTSLKGNTLSTDAFIKDLKQVHAVEKYNANKNDDFMTFDKKWSTFTDKL